MADSDTGTRLVIAHDWQVPEGRLADEATLGSAERLAPGARIRNTNNTLVMSASLVGTTYIVHYVRESQGLIRDVWLLTEAEAAEKRSGMEPETTFTFQADANKPRTDDGKTPYHLLPSYPKN